MNSHVTYGIMASVYSDWWLVLDFCPPDPVGSEDFPWDDCQVKNWGDGCHSEQDKNFTPRFSYCPGRFFLSHGI